LGLKTLPRPEFSFDGRWYDLGNNHQLHLMCIERVPGQTDQPTFDRHIALEVPDLEKTAQQLEKMQVDFARSRSGFPQLFVRDPDGNMIELRPAQ
jgi:catechol 2,3-dioxygenase-like lactoylglutathione lyase family enzyme